MHLVVEVDSSRMELDLVVRVDLVVVVMAETAEVVVMVAKATVVMGMGLASVDIPLRDLTWKYEEMSRTLKVAAGVGAVVVAVVAVMGAGSEPRLGIA